MTMILKPHLLFQNLQIYSRKYLPNFEEDRLLLEEDFEFVARFCSCKIPVVIELASNIDPLRMILRQAAR